MENKSITTHKDVSTVANKESISNASGFVQKLYKMVNCAPDDIISVSFVSVDGSI